MVYSGSMKGEGTLRTEQSPDIININVNLKWLTNRTAHMPGNKKTSLPKLYTFCTTGTLEFINSLLSRIAELIQTQSDHI